MAFCAYETLARQITCFYRALRDGGFLFAEPNQRHCGDIASHRHPLRRAVCNIGRAGLSPRSLERCLDAHGVVCVRGADLSDEAFVDLLGAMGERMFTKGEVAVESHPSLNVVTNAGRKTPPRSRFHTDSSYFRRPPSYTALVPRAVPERGGATVFIDMFAALQALPRDTYRRLKGRRMRHVVTGVDVDTAKDETECWQPIIRRHPCGREALYVTIPERMVEVEGMDAEDSLATVRDLYSFACVQPELAHEWQEGDLLVWDNRSTMHKGDHSYCVGERTLHRGLVRGEVPELA